MPSKFERIKVGAVVHSSVWDRDFTIVKVNATKDDGSYAHFTCEPVDKSANRPWGDDGIRVIYEPPVFDTFEFVY